MELSAATAL